MDSNAFLLSFGMKPEDFERTEGPIESDEGFVYEGWEARKSPACPKCCSHARIIKDRYTAEIRLRVIAMAKNERDSLAYNFMKSKWRLFLMRQRDVPIAMG